MANMCSNYVVLQGKDDNKIAFMREINEMQIKCESEDGVIVYPRCHNKDTGMSHVNLYCHEDYSFDFISRWSPAVEVLEAMCMHYRVGLKCWYEELGCGLFGMTNMSFDYDKDLLTVKDIWLTDEEIDSATETIDRGYEVGDRYFDSHEDALNHILENKIKKLSQK